VCVYLCVCVCVCVYYTAKKPIEARPLADH
jgi:hypothetical protein